MADEPEGYELIHGTGAISTLPLDEEYDVPPRRLPFGFQAPERRIPVPAVPVLSSQAWAEWLEGVQTRNMKGTNQQ